MTDTTSACIKCGHTNDFESRYCSFCGSSILLQKKQSSSKVKISIRWVIFAIISILVFEYIFAAIAGQLFTIFGGERSLDLGTSILITTTGSLGGIFFGALYSAYMSPGFSLKEPLIGAFIEIVFSQAVLSLMMESFSYMSFVRVAVIMLIAFAGAKTGDMLQKRKFRET
jgi:predicted nucleic acid-binding Zn ribbon protein